MTMNYFGPVPGYERRHRAFSNIQPFTYPDGLTYHEILERLRKYIEHTLIPFIQDGLDEISDEFKQAIDDAKALIDDAQKLVDEVQDIHDQVEVIYGQVVNLLAQAQDAAAAAKASATDAAESADEAEYWAGEAQVRAREFITPRDFGAKGDGVTDDTAAWNEFQEATGLKFVHAGRYLVDGQTRVFNLGVFGNGDFRDADGAWDQAMGDHERQSILVHRNYINANVEPVAPVIKTQSHVLLEADSDDVGGSFKHVIGAYHEGTLDGFYDTRADTNQNYTIFGSTTRNRMAGLYGSLAQLAYAEDAYESENPLIATMGATKNGCSFYRFTRKAQHKNGGYMFGQEIYGMNVANETEDIPYTNNDFFSFGGSWTAGIKVGAFATGAPISTAMFTHGSSSSKHGMWNGIVIGGSGFRINDNSDGPTGTVGLNLASWRAANGYGDVGIKFRRANRHLHFAEGARIQSVLSRFINADGPAGISIEAGGSSTNYPYLHLRHRANSDPDGGSNLTTLGTVDATQSYTRVRSINGEVQLSAGDSMTFAATAERFAPALDRDGVPHLGGANRRFNTIYATNSTISTSDERAKTDIESIPDTVLDAWEEVGYVQYRMLDAVEEKGTARLHTGVVAQRVMDVFRSHGLDAAAYGLLCHDAWEASPERVEEYTVTLREAVYERVKVKDAEYREDTQPDGTVESVEVMPAEYEDGDMLEPPVTETYRTVTPAAPAGDRYGIRYEEALALEAAVQRRRADRLEERIARLESAGSVN